jgi:hypothetical protein
MGTDTTTKKPPSLTAGSETDRVALATAALESAFDEARPQMMRWSVVTMALRDLIRSRARVDLDWVEIAQVATRWVDDLRGKGYSMAPAPPSRSLAPATAMTAPPEAGFIERHGLRSFAIAAGIVFMWFGLLKPLAQSPLADLVTRTLPFLPPALALHVVGWWQVATGACLLVPRLGRAAVVLLAVQLPALLVPFVVVPDACFAHAPFALTLVGESLIKSALLVCATAVAAQIRASSASPSRA